jgi:hypothetical protein
MTDTETPSKPARPLMVHALIFAGVAGALAVALRWAEFAFGFYGRAPDLLILFVPLIAIILAVQRWRDGVLGGSIRFSQAFRVALAVGLIFSLLQAGFAWLHVNYLQPDLIDLMVDAQSKAMQAAERSAEEIAEAEKNFRETLTPATYPRGVFVSWLVVSFVSGLLASAFMRRNVQP